MSSFIIALTVPLVLAALAIFVRPQARQVGANRVVEYGAGLRLVAWTTTAFAGATALASLFLSQADAPYMLAISGIFAIPACYLLPHAYMTRFVFGSTGIRALSPWRRQYFVAWEHIVNVRYSQGESAYVVVAPGGKELKLYASMSGVPDLVAQMQRRGVRGALLAEATAS